jgi:heme O synthase-like polyprenyltransferase
MIEAVISAVKKDGLMIAVCVAALCSFLFLLYASVYVQVKNPDVVNIMTGYSAGFMGAIVGYFFGTSKSSAEKSKTIEAMAENLKDP